MKDDIGGGRDTVMGVSIPNSSSCISVVSCMGRPNASPPLWGLCHTMSGSKGLSSSFFLSSSSSLSSLLLSPLSPSMIFRQGNLKLRPLPARANNLLMPSIRLRCPREEDLRAAFANLS